MSFLLKLTAYIDRFSAFVGRWVSWLLLVAVIVSAGNAILRKLFNVSSNAWLELQWYLYGAVFLLASAYTLHKNGHVRIDIVASFLSKRTRQWIDLLGHMFMLMPFVGLIIYLAIPWFIRSFVSGEVSPHVGGLILWPAKLLVLLGFMLLAAQAISEIIKLCGAMAGRSGASSNARSQEVGGAEHTGQP